MKNTKISWTNHTFNPWIGCQRVSPGCQHCYAEAQDQRWRAGATRWGPTAPRTRTSAAYWRQPLAWDKAAAKAGTRARVFCASLADVFEDRAELAEWRLDLLRLIHQTPRLDWLLLTKRPENIRDMLMRAGEAIRYADANAGDDEVRDWLWRWVAGGEAPANVWLGTTVEDQQRADERIPALLSVPARVRFLSCEPLLEPLDLSAFMGGPYVGLPGDVVHENYNAGIDWLIIGGESGPKARPFDVAWARSLIQQGRRAGAKVFVKQLGSAYSDPTDGIAGRGLRVPDDAAALITRRLVARAGEDPAEWPEDLRVREFPTPR